MTEKEWLGEENQLGMDIWTRKYQNQGESFEEWIHRVTGGNEEMAGYIREKKFLYGGRILSNRGLYKEGRKVTYSNCYVISPPEDNIESIFDCAKKLARTYSYGGGCGIDISGLAPKGARINNAAKETTGSVSFMELYSMVTGLIGQNGRRGALMISLDCPHPDVPDFIELKTDLEKVTKANISLRIHKDFMEAVKNDQEYTLHYTRETTGEVIEKKVKARELFRKITDTNWDYAEPGALFWDRITGCGSLHCIALFDPHTGALLETYLSKGSTGGCNNFMVGLSRMISISARGGIRIETIVDQLNSSGSCPSYTARKVTRGDTSKGACCPMAVGNALMDMYREMQEELKERKAEQEKS